MTRATTQTRFNGNDAPRRVAAVHRQGDQFNIVLAELRSGRVHVSEQQSVPARDGQRLGALLSRMAPDRVVRVLPGGSVVCRVIEIPPLDDAAAAEAAQLQAEADLPSLLGEHRRRSALLPWRTAVDNRMAAAFGWPGEAPTDTPAEVEHLTFCSESAALLELLIHSGLNEGTIASLDRDHRSMELAAHLSGITTVRTARLNENQWSSDAARVVVETALAAGADDAMLTEIEQRVGNVARTNRQGLIIDGEITQRLARSIGGVNADSAWWNRYGVATGAALAALGPRRATTELLDQPPQMPRGLLVSSLNWIGDRAHARTVIWAALLLIVVVPILGGWTRYKILGFKTRNLEDVRQASQELRAQADFFRTLRNHRWPMTKILADLGGMAPYSLEFESINIDSSSLITISGQAALGKEGDVLEFHNQLNQSHLFDEVKSPNLSFGENKIEFELQATMANPHVKVTRANDTPLAEVLYPDQENPPPGEYILGSFNLGGFSRPRSSSPPRANNSGSNGLGNLGGDTGSSPFSFPSPSSDGSSSSSTGAPGSAPGNSGSRNAQPRNLPPVLSDAQISKMDKEAVQKALLERGAVKHLEPRLKEEWDKLIERNRQLSAGPATGEDDLP